MKDISVDYQWPVYGSVGRSVGLNEKLSSQTINLCVCNYQLRLEDISHDRPVTICAMVRKHSILSTSPSIED